MWPCNLKSTMESKKQKMQTSLSSTRVNLSTTVGVLLTLLIATSIRSADSDSGYTYPFGFFNISVDSGVPIGIIEIYVCSINATQSYLSMRQSTFNTFASTTITIQQTLNLTLDYTKLTVTGAPIAGNQAATYPYGFMVSAAGETFVYAIKADLGTTDGYLVSVLTNYSKEFYLAGWPAKKDDMFYTGIMVISAFADTCVEVWAVDTVTVFNETLGENVTTVEYSYITGFFMYERYWFGMLALDRDPTGVYVNTSRPVTVISGVSCGNVPLETSFCDHMAEVVPAVSELGKVHIVPPIFGRSPQAGYVIRVVPSKLKTTVTWSIATGVVGSSVVDVGKWQEINANLSTAPMSIVCSDPCVVMQYNKGKNAVPGETSYTDPFMTLVTPVERYVSHSCFGTAIMSDADQVNIDFDNWLSLATATSNTGSIYLDGNLINPSLWQKIGDYSVATQQISPGFHAVSTDTASSATFGGWLYGHSLDQYSTSAYGFPIGYKTVGDQTEDTWSEVQVVRQTNTASKRITKCQLPFATGGTGVASYGANNGFAWTVYNAIQLVATLPAGVTTTSACRSAYTAALQNLMTNVSKNLNYQVCAQSICANMTGGGPGFVVDPGDFASGVIATTMFVAIDTSSTESNINLDVSNNVLTAIRIKFQYVGILDTNAVAYANCRREIQDFLIPFVNWMTLINNGFVPASTNALSSSSSQASLSQGQKNLIASNQIVETPVSCPALSFNSARFAPASITC